MATTQTEHLVAAMTYPAMRPSPPLGLGQALLGTEEEELLLQVIRSKRLFRYSYDLPPEEQGEMTATLEREFREMMGTKFALGVTSGTAALEVALGALGIGPGDEVILPAWSWISCFTSVVRLGARPVLAEIDETFCLASGEITRLCTPRTKAVMVIHYQGVGADMDPLMKEARAAGISVLEDCAESTGALYKGRRLGSIGDMGIYSFQFQKTMTSGEGGLIVTSDPRLYERAVRFHDLGSVRAHHLTFIDPTEPEFCGGQYRMNEMTAAVAVAQRRKVDDLRSHCRSLRDRIMDQIQDLSGLAFRRIPDPEGDSGFEIYFFLENELLAQRFTKLLKEHNVNCTKMTGTYCHYARSYCQNRQAHTAAASPFREFSDWPAPGYRQEDFPRTEDLVNRFVTLTIGVRYREADADYIADVVRAVHHELNL